MIYKSFTSAVEVERIITFFKYRKSTKNLLGVKVRQARKAAICEPIV
jgi:hypothetical protein